MTNDEVPLENVVDELGEIFSEDHFVLRQIQKKLEDDADRKHQDEQRNLQIELQTATYHQAQAFENAILIAGYAGFFGLFSLTKDIIDNYWNVFAAMCLGVSITTYVAWQIFSMINRSINGLRHLNLILTAPENFHEAAQAWLESQRSATPRIQVLWYLTLAISVASAALGASTLMISFALYLINEF